MQANLEESSPKLKTKNWLLIGQKSCRKSIKQSDSLETMNVKPSKFTPSKEKYDENKSKDRTIKDLKQTLLNAYKKTKPKEENPQKRGRMSNQESLDDKSLFQTGRSQTKSYQKMRQLKFRSRGIESDISFACKTTKELFELHQKDQSSQNQSQNQKELEMLREKLLIAVSENKQLKQQFSTFKKMVSASLKTQQQYIEGIAQEILKDYRRKCISLKLSSRQKEDQIIEIKPDTHLDIKKLSFLRNKLTDRIPDPCSTIIRRGHLISDLGRNRVSRSGSGEKNQRADSFQKLFFTIQKLKSSMQGTTQLQPNNEKQQENTNSIGNILKPSPFAMQNSVLFTPEADMKKKQSKKFGILKAESKLSCSKKIISPTSSNGSAKKIDWKTLFYDKQNKGATKRGLILR